MAEGDVSASVVDAELVAVEGEDEVDVVDATVLETLSASSTPVGLALTGLS